MEYSSNAKGNVSKMQLYFEKIPKKFPKRVDK